MYVMRKTNFIRVQIPKKDVSLIISFPFLRQKVL